MLSDPDQASLLLQRALRVYTTQHLEGSANLYVMLAGEHARAGRSDSARADYGRGFDEAADSENWQFAILASLGAGKVDLSANRPDSAFKLFWRALEISEEIGNVDFQAQALVGLYAAVKAGAKQNQLLPQIEQRARRLAARPQVSDSASRLAFRGVTEMIAAGSFDRSDQRHAIPQLLAAAAKFRIARDSAGEAQALASVGQRYLASGGADSSIAYFHKAAGLAPAHPAILSAVLGQLGFIYRRWVGQPDSAILLLRRALATSGEYTGRSLRASLLVELATSQKAAGQIDSARATYARALRVYREIVRSQHRRETTAGIASLFSLLGEPDSASFYYRRLADSAWILQEWRVLVGLARGHHRGKQRNLRRAVAYYDSANATLFGLAVHGIDDENRIGQADEADFVGDWALAWLARESEVGADWSSRGSAAAVERARSRALLASISGDLAAQVISFPEADSAFVESVEQAQLVSYADTLALEYVVTSDTLIVWVRNGAKKVAVRRVPITRDSLSILVRVLRATLGVNAGPARGFKAIDLEGDAGQRGIKDDASALAGLNADTVNGRLSGILLPLDLIARLPSGVPLVIIPQGILSLVPFAALRLGPEVLLGERFALVYAPSHTVFANLQSRQLRRTTGGKLPPDARTIPFSSASDPSQRAAWRTQLQSDALIVGDPIMPMVTTATGVALELPQLPGSEDEARDVARVLRARAPLLGPAATEDVVRQRLHRATLVHLATHGFAFGSRGRAADSFLALAASATNDGVLTLRELLADSVNGALALSLVVLSACQTGLGNLSESEGVVGLARVFLAKGASSVIVSQWNVSDTATAILMHAFYLHWLNDPDAPNKAEALRRAQGDLRDSHRNGGRFTRPRYWAAFQLVGALAN